MAEDQRRVDRLDQERLDEADRRNIPSDGGRGGDLDMGGGGPTGASGPGTPHRSNLDTRGGSPLTGALDDLPDMTGANAAAGGGNTAGIGGTTTSGSTDAWVSTIGDRDINPPGGDNANMGQGGDRFDASDAYTGVESDDAVLNAGTDSSLERNTRSRTTRDLAGSGDSGTAGEDLGDMPGQGISPEDFRTQGSRQ
jgi:hypothetical protein